MAVLQFVITLALIGWTQAYNCPYPNGYFPDESRCEKFWECREGVAEEVSCPDGLLVNEKAAAFRYPCDYPVDVECGKRTIPPAEGPSGNCARKWGMFKTGSDNSCGDFVNCVDGVEHQFKCPEGLAWHPTLWRCEWPDQVPTCNVEAFLGFKCPDVDEYVAATNPVYGHPTDCARYFVCIEGNKPRLNVCGAKTVFDKSIGACGAPENVPACANYYPPESEKYSA
ncbi:protein obstructor-E-like [Daphnia pulex]|uniref:protein obstructor-E-like n=1 Tax=Daphnia pulex TaxID=6669 RepID=UPI001EE070FE|nr:protein obstructor-E-like [Daphnia pulex]